jgi:DNA-binding response OmpR family regulator
MLVAFPKVLVVEDDEAIRSLLSAALRRLPLQVDSVADGAEALELTARQDYAVILLDLMLPRVNGIEFLHSFRSEKPRASSIIILLTAFDDLALRRFEIEQAHALIRKPFDLHLLVEMVHEIALNYTSHADLLGPAPDLRQPAR